MPDSRRPSLKSQSTKPKSRFDSAAKKSLRCRPPSINLDRNYHPLTHSQKPVSDKREQNINMKHPLVYTLSILHKRTGFSDGRRQRYFATGRSFESSRLSLRLHARESDHVWICKNNAGRLGDYIDFNLNSQRE